MWFIIVKRGLQISRRDGEERRRPPRGSSGPFISPRPQQNTPSMLLATCYRLPTATPYSGHYGVPTITGTLPEDRSALTTLPFPAKAVSGLYLSFPRRIERGNTTFSSDGSKDVVTPCFSTVITSPTRRSSLSRIEPSVLKQPEIARDY